jgi:hypothetical protein
LDFGTPESLSCEMSAAAKADERDEAPVTYTALFADPTARPRHHRNTLYDCILMMLQPTPSFAIIQAALSDAGPGSSDILIGVVDGMPDLDHPSLRSSSIEVLEHMVPPDTAGVDAHGTGICSLIFGSGDPVIGLAPACKGLILPLFFRKGHENAIRPVSQLDLARAISFALERGVSIINVSAGQKSVTTEAEGHLEQALEHCIERRVLVTAAAGNDRCACINLPAGVESRPCGRCPG